MKPYKLPPEADRDLENIGDYIAANNPAAADLFIDQITKALRDLAAAPGLGHARPDLTDFPLRFKAVRDYLIVYAPEETPLWVITIVHGRCEPQVISELLQDRA